MDGATDTSVNQKSGETLNKIRIEQSLEKPSEGASELLMCIVYFRAIKHVDLYLHRKTCT